MKFLKLSAKILLCILALLFLAIVAIHFILVYVAPSDSVKEKIIVTYQTDNMLKTKPEITQAHRVRSVMQNYFFIKAYPKMA